MQSKNALLHLSLIESIGPATINCLLDVFNKGALSRESFELIYSMSVSDIMYYGAVSEKKAHVLYKGLANRSLLDKELSLIDRYKIEWVTIFDDSYPFLLKNIYLPPLVLYAKSLDGSVVSQKNIAVVGSRKADSYGKTIIQKLIPHLCERQWTIVSGGAIGIDALAHRAAIDNGGKTIAVLGSGLLKPYPAANKQLFKSIIESGGALVSCFPLMLAAQPGLFPARNRIIAGLAQGCVVIQAAVKSGALITAQHALNEGREVFAVPGAIENPLSEGCHQLISNGAHLVHSADSILKVFNDVNTASAEGGGADESKYQQNLVAENIKDESNNKKKMHLDPLEQTIFELCKEPVHFDEVLCESGVTRDVLQEKLLDLMLEGKINQNVLGYWQKIY